MDKTWKPTTAGILTIISGALTILGSIGLILGMMFFIPVAQSFGPSPMPEFGAWMIPNILSTVLIGGVVYLIIVGIIPIIGGIYALRRRAWGLALAGSILAIFGSSIIGILATIFTAVSKEEFE